MFSFSIIFLLQSPNLLSNFVLNLKHTTNNILLLTLGKLNLTSV